MNAANQARQSAIDYNKSLEQMTFRAKAATVASKALAAVGNMLVFALVAKGIELAVKGIGNYIHRVQIAKNSVIEDIQTGRACFDYADVSSQIAELLRYYDELTQIQNKFKDNTNLSDWEKSYLPDDYPLYSDYRVQNTILEPIPYIQHQLNVAESSSKQGTISNLHYMNSIPMNQKRYMSMVCF